jgi:RNA polymerase sigma-70 factor, ECF subfamily
MTNAAQKSEKPLSGNISIPILGTPHGSRASGIGSKQPATHTEEPLSPSAFDALVRAYSADLFRFAFWLCRNRWQAQDLVQETFTAAWKGRQSLRQRGSAKAWLFSILRNEHVRVFQKKRLDIANMELDDLDVASQGGELERVELEECLRVLPENLREPLMLQVLGGFSGKEIAAMLNLSEQNVMTRLTRARQALLQLGSSGADAFRRKINESPDRSYF